MSNAKYSVREEDFLFKLDKYCRDKIGYTPFVPGYVREHSLGPSTPVALNLTTLIIAQTGYQFCEITLQNDKENWQALNNAVDSLDKSVAQALHYQGSDFFAGVFYTQLFGAAVTEGVRMGSCLTAPKSGFTRFVDNHYRIIRSVVGFAALVGYEVKQSVERHGPIDRADVAAYAAGITLMLHGGDIVHGIKKIFGRAAKKPETTEVAAAASPKKQKLTL